MVSAIIGKLKSQKTRAATIVAAARRKGFSISVSDGQIAATAAAHGLSVATRDGAPFRAAGLEVIDPWTEGAA